MKNKLQGCGNALAMHTQEMLEHQTKLELVRIKREALHIEHVDIDGNDGTVVQFASHDIAVLNAYSLMKKFDRQFVGKALQIMYKEDPSALSLRSLRIKRRDPQNKLMTPEKVQKVVSLMIDRAGKVLDPSEKIDRSNIKYIKSIISKELYEIKNSKAQ